MILNMLIKSLTLILLLILFGVNPLSAEFIQTSPAVFQSTDLKTKVITSEKGIFIVKSREEIPLQKFNPSLLMSLGTYNLFIEYNERNKLFTKMLSGNKEYKIKGSFGINLDDIRIRIDNFRNPYLTIVTGSTSSKPSILGFLALSPVVNFSSNEAVALLEGNQSFSEISDIRPYKIDTEGQITLAGEKINTNMLGLNIQLPNNPCLKNNNSIFISESIFKKVKEIAELDKKNEVIANILKLKKQNDFISKLIILKAQKTIIAFEPNQNSVYSIKNIPLDQDSFSGQETFCVYEKIDINEK